MGKGNNAHNVVGIQMTPEDIKGLKEYQSNGGAIPTTPDDRGGAEKHQLGGRAAGVHQHRTLSGMDGHVNGEFGDRYTVLDTAYPIEIPSGLSSVGGDEAGVQNEGDEVDDGRFASRVSRRPMSGYSPQELAAAINGHLGNRTGVAHKGDEVVIFINGDPQETRTRLGIEQEVGRDSSFRGSPELNLTVPEAVRIVAQLRVRNNGHAVGVYR